jgi:peroxisomal membrane protein 4
MIDDNCLVTSIEPEEKCLAMMDEMSSSTSIHPLGIINVIMDIINGFKKGLVYGVKIRLPHALVMTFLFKDGSFEDKIKTILRLTRDHAGRLACYVALYKTLLFALKRINSEDDKWEIRANWRVFMAGAVSGYVVFGREEDAVNSQIIYYLISRVLMGSMRCLYKSNVTIQSSINSIVKALPIVPKGLHAWQAILAWGMVMWLWEKDAEVLQRTLKQSMDYLYKADGEWRGWQHLFFQTD